MFEQSCSTEPTVKNKKQSNLEILFRLKFLSATLSFVDAEMQCAFFRQEAEATSSGSERENTHRNGGGGGAWPLSKWRGRAPGTAKRREKEGRTSHLLRNSLPGARCRCQAALLLLSSPASRWGRSRSTVTLTVCE